MEPEVFYGYVREKRYPSGWAVVLCSSSTREEFSVRMETLFEKYVGGKKVKITIKELEDDTQENVIMEKVQELVPVPA